jgi:hypothetical protein
MVNGETRTDRHEIAPSVDPHAVDCGDNSPGDDGDKERVEEVTAKRSVTGVDTGCKITKQDLGGDRKPRWADVCDDD